MRGVFNGYSINGSSVPDWLRRATVIAAAAATAAIAPTRTTFASSFGDASAAGIVSAQQNSSASAAGTAEATSYASPGIRYSGRSIATVESTGNASIIRLVPATSGGDAYSYGIANAADKLGEAESSAQSTVVSCLAHIIKPASSLATATLTEAQPNGDVNRYALVDAVGSISYTRSEASVRRTGELFYSHDGYVLDAIASASAAIDPSKVGITSGFGSFEFSDSTGACLAFVVHPGASGAMASSSGSLVGSFTHGGTSAGSAASSGGVSGYILVPASATGLAEASAQANGVWYGQAFSTADSLVSSEVTAVRTCYAWSASSAGADHLLSNGPTVIKLGSVNTIAYSMSGLAFATSNADVPAIAERRVLVEREARGIEVPNENRTVVA